MRLLLLILMIALVPLRSWALVAEHSSAHATTFSAIEKEATQAQPVVLISQFSVITEHPCHAAATSTPEDAAQPTQVKHPTHQTTCATCGDCTLCHTLASAAAPQLPAPLFLAHWLRPSSGDRFDSALAALSLKPPIA